jgi:hypothetical protein
MDRNNCPKTLSGKHLWKSKRRFSVYGESLEDVERCIACGMVNDLEKQKDE